jgi:hypothetical protein
MRKFQRNQLWCFQTLIYIVLNPKDWPKNNLLATATGDAMAGETCIIQKEIPLADRPVEPPPPTLAMARDSHSPCFLALEHLELIFETRRDMMDQLHRHALFNNRLDILFDAFSCTQS